MRQKGENGFDAREKGTHGRKSKRGARRGKRDGTGGESSLKKKAGWTAFECGADFRGKKGGGGWVGATTGVGHDSLREKEGNEGKKGV